MSRFARLAALGTALTVRCRPGDNLAAPGDRRGRAGLVVADADAVIVVPAADAEAALAAAEARAAREAGMMERLRAGESTLQILGLTEGEKG